MPIGLQAFAHYLKQINPYNRALSDQINSPAAKQMLWRHLDSVQGTAEMTTEREEFLAELERVGGWPRIPRLLAVANGRGDGSGNGASPVSPPCAPPVRSFPRTVLHTQQEGAGAVVAELRAAPRQARDGHHRRPPGVRRRPRRHPRLLRHRRRRPERPAPGERRGPGPRVCFVPTVSAVSVRDLDTTEPLHTDIDKTDPGGERLRRLPLRLGERAAHRRSPRSWAPGCSTGSDRRRLRRQAGGWRA